MKGSLYTKHEKPKSIMQNNTMDISINQIPITITRGWDEYELLDSGDGMKLERYGKILLSRRNQKHSG